MQKILQTVQVACSVHTPPLCDTQVAAHNRSALPHGIDPLDAFALRLWHFQQQQGQPNSRGPLGPHNLHLARHNDTCFLCCCCCCCWASVHIVLLLPLLLLLLPSCRYSAASCAESTTIRSCVHGPLIKPLKPWLLLTGIKPQPAYSCCAEVFSAATCSNTQGSPQALAIRPQAAHRVLATPCRRADGKTAMLLM